MENLSWDLLAALVNSTAGMGEGLGKEHRKSYDLVLSWLQREPRVAAHWHAASRTLFRMLRLGKAYVAYGIENGAIEVLLKELPNWEAAAALPCILRFVGGANNDFAPTKDLSPSNDEAIKRLQAATAVALLSPTLERHRLDQNVQNHVVQLLCKLLNTAGAVAAFQKADGFPNMVEILKVHKKNAKVMEYTLSCLNQVMLDVARTDELVKAGAVKATVKVLSKNFGRPKNVSLALTALSKIAEFQAPSLHFILKEWDQKITDRFSPEDIPAEVHKMEAIFRMENYTQYGGGTAAVAYEACMKYQNDPNVVKHALQCLRSKAWDPQKRLEFKEIPDFIKGISKVTRTHNRSREVLLAGAELCKVSMERGLMALDDPKFDEFADFAVVLIENIIGSSGTHWKPVHWLLILDTIKLVARRPAGFKALTKRSIRNQLLDKTDAGGSELRAMTTDVVNILNIPL
jgi:hypothetical protein